MNPVIKEILYKKGIKTSELGATAITGLVAGAAALGLFDVSEETVSNVAAVSGQVAENIAAGVDTIKEMRSGSMTVMDGLIRIVGLIIGGQVVSAYIKARSETKGAVILSYIKEMKEMKEAEKSEKEEFKNGPNL